MEKPQIIEYLNHSVNYTLFGGKWVPASSRCVLFGQHAKGTGAIQVLSMSDGSLQLDKQTTHKSGIKCGTFGASTFEERHIALGDFDGGLTMWDLERLDTPLFAAKQHTQIINCIDGAGGLAQGGAPELATGSRDGSVKIWDTRQRDVPVADLQPEDASAARDCWAVAFGNSYDSERCVAAGYDNGDLKLFDLRTMSMRWEETLPNGICSIQFDRADIPMNKMLVTGLESQFHVFDMRTYSEDKGYVSVAEKSHKSTVWVGSHSPHDRDVFVTCGGNGSLNLWSYKYPPSRQETDDDGKVHGVAGTIQYINNAMLSSQPINCFDWNSDMRGLSLVTAFDQAARVCFVSNLNLL